MPRTTRAQPQSYRSPRPEVVEVDGVADADDDGFIDDTPVVAVVAPRPSKNARLVHHWAKVWLGQPDPRNSLWYQWHEQESQIEVTVQQYDQPRWAEDLMTEMIEAAKEVLADAESIYTASRIRVRLFSHRPDGSDARFTWEYIHKR